MLCMIDRKKCNRLGAISWLFSRGVCGIGLLLVAFAGCSGEEPPAGLIGIWMATSPRHEGRFLEISEGHLIFGSDEIHSTFYAIRGVESEDLESGILYTIDYYGVGGTGRKLFVRLSDGEPEAIKLENQDGIWIRKDRVASKPKGLI